MGTTASSSSGRIKSISIGPSQAKHKGRGLQKSESQFGDEDESSSELVLPSVESVFLELAASKRQIIELQNINESLTGKIAELEQEADDVCQGQELTALNDIVNSKNSRIDSLESELKTTIEALETLKKKYKTKMQQFKMRSEQKKQEASLYIFELRDEITRLKAENDELLRNTNQHSLKLSSKDTVPSTRVDSRSEVIVQLSTQISDQEYKISSLQSELKEKDHLIAKLTNVEILPEQAHTLIELERAKASEEIHHLAKEIKAMTKKKKRNKPVSGNLNLSREQSSISKDSGAADLLSLTDIHTAGADSFN